MPAPRKVGTSSERGSDATISPAVIWQMVRQYWSTALGTAVAVALIATFNTLGQTKIYQAHTTIQFDPNPPRPLGQKVETVVDLGSGSFWDNHEYYETQYKIIQSMKVSLAVVNELGLNRDGGFLGNLPPGALAPEANVPEENAAESLRGRIKVEPIKESRLAVVKLEDADPKRAQRILAAIVDTYVQQNLDDAVASTASATDLLRSQLDKLKVDLELSETALHEYKEQKQIPVALEDQSNMLRDEMKQINDALTALRNRREEIQARHQELSKIKADNPAILPATELLQSDLLMSMRTQYEEAVRTRDGLLGMKKGHNYPDVQEAEAKALAARKALLSEVRNIQGALNKDLAVIKLQEAGLSVLFERAKKQASDLNLLETEYNRLRRSKENNEKLYSLVLERTKESDLGRVLRVNNIRVLDRPLVPRTPVRPAVSKNIAVGVFLGLILGIAAALGRGLLDRSVKTPDEVENDLGLPFLGLLPEIEPSVEALSYAKKGKKQKVPPRGMGNELIVHERPTSGVAEAARTIRTNLLFMAPDHPYKTLLVTSAGPSEGKTTVATCIAVVMAQAGQRVVLIDCDLRRPRVHRIFRKGSAVGVTTALLDESIDDCVLDTSVPNLSVIPAGPIPPNPAELLHSAKFKNFLKQVEERFDRIIIDSPPIVPVTDAAVLSTLVDGTVLVIRAFKTTKDLARHAARALSDLGATRAGAVLNAVNFSRHEYKNKYHYYSRDDGYFDDEAPPDAERKAARDEESENIGSAPPPV
jgi:capsular exopolysaccharide synthesis family protein